MDKYTVNNVCIYIGKRKLIGYNFNKNDLNICKQYRVFTQQYDVINLLGALKAPEIPAAAP